MAVTQLSRAGGQSTQARRNELSSKSSFAAFQQNRQQCGKGIQRLTEKPPLGFHALSGLPASTAWMFLATCIASGMSQHQEMVHLIKTVSAYQNLLMV